MSAFGLFRRVVSGTILLVHATLSLLYLGGVIRNRTCLPVVQRGFSILATEMVTNIYIVAVLVLREWAVTSSSAPPPYIDIDTGPYVALASAIFVFIGNATASTRVFTVVKKFRQHHDQHHKMGPPSSISKYNDRDGHPSSSLPPSMSLWSWLTARPPWFLLDVRTVTGKMVVLWLALVLTLTMLGFMWKYGSHFCLYICRRPNPPFVAHYFLILPVSIFFQFMMNYAERECNRVGGHDETTGILTELKQLKHLMGVPVIVYMVMLILVDTRVQRQNLDAVNFYFYCNNMLTMCGVLWIIHIRPTHVHGYSPFSDPRRVMASSPSSSKLLVLSRSPSSSSSSSSSSLLRQRPPGGKDGDGQRQQEEEEGGGEGDIRTATSSATEGRRSTSGTPRSSRGSLPTKEIIGSPSSSLLTEGMLSNGGTERGRLVVVPPSPSSADTTMRRSSGGGGGDDEAVMVRRREALAAAMCQQLDVLLVHDEGCVLWRDSDAEPRLLAAARKELNEEAVTCVLRLVRARRLGGSREEREEVRSLYRVVVRDHLMPGASLPLDLHPVKKHHLAHLLQVSARRQVIFADDREATERAALLPLQKDLAPVAFPIISHFLQLTQILADGDGAADETVTMTPVVAFE